MSDDSSRNTLHFGEDRKDMARKDLSQVDKGFVSSHGY